MKRTALLCAAALMGVSAFAGEAAAQASTPYLGQLMDVGFNFCPRNWTEANGQIMAISTNTALFSLYGTMYGGNGVTTFALPDLRGRVAVHSGQGPGLPNVDQGQVWGTPTTTLNVSNLPRHNHILNATGNAPDTPNPSGGLLATFTGTTPIYSSNGAADKIMNPLAIGFAGSNIPFEQYQPSLGMRWCVALQGVFPSRN